MTCIHDAFERQAAVTPDAPAVTGGGRDMTYAELRRRANRVSGVLREAGVGPDVPVVLFAERCASAVVGILGILQAGAPYVPIDPREPDARVAAIVADSGATLVLAQPHLRERVIPAAVTILDLDETAIHGRIDDHTLDAGVNPENLAAVIYTSGTTGSPKGVEIPHRAIMARVRNGYAARPNDLQKAPLSVVAHISDLLLPLLSGGPVIFVPDACFGSGRSLLDVVLRYGTTRMVFVPSQLSALLGGGSDAVSALARLECVIVSGEPLTPGLVATFERLLPHVTLVNAYGASEVAGLACMGEVSSVDDITVGTAIRGCEAYILDEDLRPTMPGVAGEVYLGGAQVARGYRNNPSPTEQRFLPNPFNGAGGRMYRTGDVAERLADGRIRILGRHDLEVKVRGHRVNLSEVEAVLERVPGVQRAVVTMEGEDANQLVSAWVMTSSPRDRAGAADIRAALAAQLPAYMLPNEVRFVDHFPLLPGGKIDRATLTRRGYEPESIASSDAERIAPRTSTERTLVDIWQALLGLQVSVSDDFFALGGDSLNALRFVLRAEDEGLSVTLQQLHDAPSLAALARVIDAEGGYADEPRAGESAL